MSKQPLGGVPRRSSALGEGEGSCQGTAREAVFFRQQAARAGACSHRAGGWGVRCCCARFCRAPPSRRRREGAVGGEEEGGMSGRAAGEARGQQAPWASSCPCGAPCGAGPGLNGRTNPAGFQQSCCWSTTNICGPQRAAAPAALCYVCCCLLLSAAAWAGGAGRVETPARPWLGTARLWGSRRPAIFLVSVLRYMYTSRVGQGPSCRPLLPRGAQVLMTGPSGGGWLRPYVTKLLHKVEARLQGSSQTNERCEPPAFKGRRRCVRTPKPGRASTRSFAARPN